MRRPRPTPTAEEPEPAIAPAVVAHEQVAVAAPATPDPIPTVQPPPPTPAGGLGEFLKFDTVHSARTTTAGSQMAALELAFRENAQQVENTGYNPPFATVVGVDADNEGARRPVTMASGLNAVLRVEPAAGKTERRVSKTQNLSGDVAPPLEHPHGTVFVGLTRRPRATETVPQSRYVDQQVGLGASFFHAFPSGCYVWTTGKVLTEEARPSWFSNWVDQAAAHTDHTTVQGSGKYRATAETEQLRGEWATRDHYAAHSVLAIEPLISPSDPSVTKRVRQRLIVLASEELQRFVDSGSHIEVGGAPISAERMQEIASGAAVAPAEVTTVNAMNVEWVRRQVPLQLSTAFSAANATDQFLWEVVDGTASHSQLECAKKLKTSGDNRVFLDPREMAILQAHPEPGTTLPGQNSIPINTLTSVNPPLKAGEEAVAWGQRLGTHLEPVGPLLIPASMIRPHVRIIAPSGRGKTRAAVALLVALAEKGALVVGMNASGGNAMQYLASHAKEKGVRGDVAHIQVGAADKIVVSGDLFARNGYADEATHQERIKGILTACVGSAAADGSGGAPDSELVRRYAEMAAEVFFELPVHQQRAAAFSQIMIDLPNRPNAAAILDEMRKQAKDKKSSGYAADVENFLRSLDALARQFDQPGAPPDIARIVEAISTPGLPSSQEIDPDERLAILGIEGPEGSQLPKILLYISLFYSIHDYLRKSYGPDFELDSDLLPLVALYIDEVQQLVGGTQNAQLRRFLLEEIDGALATIRKYGVMLMESGTSLDRFADANISRGEVGLEIFFQPKGDAAEVERAMGINETHPAAGVLGHLPNGIVMVHLNDKYYAVEVPHVRSEFGGFDAITPHLAKTGFPDRDRFLATVTKAELDANQEELKRGDHMQLQVTAALEAYNILVREATDLPALSYQASRFGTYLEPATDTDGRHRTDSQGGWLWQLSDYGRGVLAEVAAKMAGALTGDAARYMTRTATAEHRGLSHEEFYRELRRVLYEVLQARVLGIPISDELQHQAAGLQLAPVAAVNQVRPKPRTVSEMAADRDSAHQIYRAHHNEEPIAGLAPNHRPADWSQLSEVQQLNYELGVAVAATTTWMVESGIHDAVMRDLVAAATRSVRVTPGDKDELRRAQARLGRAAQHYEAPSTASDNYVMRRFHRIVDSAQAGPTTPPTNTEAQQAAQQPPPPAATDAQPVAGPLIEPKTFGPLGGRTRRSPVPSTASADQSGDGMPQWLRDYTDDQARRSRGVR